MTTSEVLLVIRGYQKRLEHWDDLLVNLAANIAAPAKKGKKLDPKKMRLYKREGSGASEAESRLKDSEYAASFLERIKQRERR